MLLFGSLLKRISPIALALLLAACSTTGQGFKASGISNITVGETTLEQASEYLHAKPVNIWQQGDSTLARWAVKNTVATDALYIRQEAWLRFGPDGTFQQVENTVNVPALIKPKPAPEQPTKVWQAPTINGSSNDLNIPAGDSTGIQVETLEAKQPSTSNQNSFTYPVDLD